ncbi:unnamed protein product [Chilo suppressalis]|uniref:Odorant receptor n=1 Tax=Chilo suppressalis TaxID=168631 RepID=A0ABN8B2R5_CHISP|nr:unnamed protein product [Chilo suppressalis]
MDETLYVFHRIFSMAGVSIYAKKNWISKAWLGLLIFNAICGVLCFVFTTGFVVTNTTDIEIFIRGSCIWSSGVPMAITFVLCLIYRFELRGFLEEMAFKDEMQAMPLIQHVNSLTEGNLLYELKELVRMSQMKLANFSRIFLKVYIMSVLVIATLYPWSSIYEMCVTEDDTLRLIGFDMWFPWSLDDISVYVMSFLFNVYLGCLCSIAYPGLQTTIVLFLGQLIRQLRILNFILLNLSDLVDEIVGDQNHNDIWQEVCNSLLCQCVDHYVKLKSFSNRINLTFHFYYLALLLMATVLVCMCSVKIAISDKLALDTMKYYMHGFCFIMMVLLLCTLGQQVNNECEKLEESVTNKWYLYNKNLKVNIQIFKMALDQRMPISIFGSATLSFPTFTWFIKTGTSFFTLVMSVLDN